MSDIIREARSKMQSRASRFVSGDKPGKVDCSDFTPEPLDVESDEKNSGQPNNARMRYKRGGKVVGAEGEKPKQNAGKKPRVARAMGGPTPKEAADYAKGTPVSQGNIKPKYAMSGYQGEQARAAKTQVLGNKDVTREKADRYYSPANRAAGKVREVTTLSPGEKKPRKTDVWTENRGKKVYGEYADGGRTARKDGGKAEWSPEARAAAVNKDRGYLGVGRSTPAEGLAHKLQKEPLHNPDEGQWGAMMAAMPRNGRQKAQSVYGGRKVTSEREYNKGGKVHSDAAEDKKLIDKIVKPEARRDARAEGGRLKPVNGPIKSIYGNANVARELNKPLSEKQAMADNMRRNREARSTGGDIALGLASPAGLAAKELGLKSGGRTERASGGRAKSGKTNINIIIGANKPNPGDMPPPMMPPVGAAPVAPPPDGALPPQAGAPAPAAPMGMPRKDGGRTIKMEYGAGGGKGRLEKLAKYD